MDEMSLRLLDSMEYFNSFTVKILSNIIKKLDRYSAGNNKVTVNCIAGQPMLNPIRLRDRPGGVWIQSWAVFLT